jgi:hypothetical protein
MTLQEYKDKIIMDLDLNYGDSMYISNVFEEIKNNLPKPKDLAKSHGEDCLSTQSTSNRGDFGADCNCDEYLEAIGYNQCLKEIKEKLK